MKLLVVGDSFTYGDELEDRLHAWPYLLEKLVKCQVSNRGQSASGNSRMVRTIVEEIDNYDLFIIAWSQFGRMEFADDSGIYDVWPGCNPAAHKQHSPHRIELIKYITNHYSDQHLYKQYLVNIILLQNFFRSQGKKYLMLDAFANNQSNLRYSKELANLKKRVDSKYFVGWPMETMMEWTKDVPKGPCGHFLEDGHKIVAEKINEHIRNLGWVS